MIAGFNQICRATATDFPFIQCHRFDSRNRNAGFATPFRMESRICRTLPLILFFTDDSIVNKESRNNDFMGFQSMIFDDTFYLSNDNTTAIMNCISIFKLIELHRFVFNRQIAIFINRSPTDEADINRAG